MLQEESMQAAELIEKSANVKPEDWEERLKEIILKVDSDSKLTDEEKTTLIDLAEKANEQLHILKAQTDKLERVVNPNDFTQIEAHIPGYFQKKETEEEIKLFQKMQAAKTGKPIVDDTIEAEMEIDGKPVKIKLKAADVSKKLGLTGVSAPQQSFMRPGDKSLLPGTGGDGPPPRFTPNSDPFRATADKKSKLLKMVD